jgi:cysteine desulfurase/selenocysteine lyase
VIGDFFSKEDFLTLKNNPDLVYLDNAATTQTHRWVVERMNKYYNLERATTHRGSYPLCDRATDDYEFARQQVANLISADPSQLMFTTGATQGLNFVAEWHKDVPVAIISAAEHTSNILPWLASGRSIENGRLKVIPIKVYNDGSQGFDLDAAKTILEKHPESILSITTNSNVTGFNTEWETLTDIARQYGTSVCLDATQTIAHKKLDVSLRYNKSPDWMVFSSHKMYGPTGVGALYHRHGFDNIRPLTFGGGQIDHVDFNNIIFKTSLEKVEPGTQNIAGVLGFGMAAEFINYVTYEEIKRIEYELYNYFLANKDIQDIKELDPLYPNKELTSIFSFRSKLSPYDIATILGSKNVAVRSGKLCAHPFVNQLSNNGILRVSLAPYNTFEDIDFLGSKLKEAVKLLK